MITFTLTSIVIVTPTLIKSRNTVGATYITHKSNILWWRIKIVVSILDIIFNRAGRATRLTQISCVNNIPPLMSPLYQLLKTGVVL
jgi:hypothetical protein